MVLCYVICVECRDLEDSVVSWGKRSIKGERDVLVHCEGGLDIGWTLKEDSPLLVASVCEGSPAEAAQIAPGSRIDKINGEYVITNTEVENVMASCAASCAVSNSPGAHIKKIKVTLSDSPLPNDSHRSFLKLRQHVAARASRLCPVVHYVFFDICMYFLTDFSETKEMKTSSVVELLVRHIPQGTMVAVTVYRVSRFNGATRRLRRVLNEVAASKEWSEERRGQIESFQNMIKDSMPRMCMYIFGFAVDRQFICTAVALAVQYMGLGSKILKFTGLASIIPSRSTGI